MTTTELIEHADCPWRQVGPCVYCTDHGVRLFMGDLPERKRTIPQNQPPNRHMHDAMTPQCADDDCDGNNCACPCHDGWNGWQDDDDD